MNHQKIELVGKVRNSRMTGMTYKAIAAKFGISESSCRKYCLKNVTGSAVFYSVRKARKERVSKVVSYLKNDYCMTFNSTLKFINSLGIRMTEHNLARIFYGSNR